MELALPVLTRLANLFYHLDESFRDVDSDSFVLLFAFNHL